MQVMSLQHDGIVMGKHAHLSGDAVATALATALATTAPSRSLVNGSDNYEAADYPNAPSLPDLEDEIRRDEISLPMYTTKKHGHV